MASGIGATVGVKEAGTGGVAVMVPGTRVAVGEAVLVGFTAAKNPVAVGLLVGVETSVVVAVGDRTLPVTI